MVSSAGDGGALGHKYPPRDPEPGELTGLNRVGGMGARLGESTPPPSRALK